MSAADVIKQWSDQLQQDGSYMLGVAAAIQTGNPILGSNSLVGFAEIAVSRRADGGLNSPESVLLFSDRQENEADDSIDQPFDVGQADSNAFVLTLDGNLEITSHTWGGTETFALSDLGNGVLGGFGINSIGNKNVPPYWTITVDQTIRQP
jgi:hypothetical protein